MDRYRAFLPRPCGGGNWTARRSDSRSCVLPAALGKAGQQATIDRQSIRLLPLSCDLRHTSGWESTTEGSIKLVVQSANRGRFVDCGRYICARECFWLINAQLEVQIVQKLFGEPPDLSLRNLGAFGYIKRVEGEQIIGRDQRLLQRWQQV